MAQKIEVPWLVQWGAEVLRTIPSANEAWASIVGHLAWPALALFVLLRFQGSFRQRTTAAIDRLL